MLTAIVQLAIVDRRAARPVTADLWVLRPSDAKKSGSLARHTCQIEVPEVTAMPRSIQDILDHADELAKRFEEYEPGEGDERLLEEYLLERAVLTRARSERQIVDAVVAARAAGISWNKMGETLGTSAQAAQQRYGEVIEQV
jgi:hypothetical protein